MQDIILDIHNIKQVMNVDDMSKKLKDMIVDRTIEDNGDTIKITFILDKNIGDKNNG